MASNSFSINSTSQDVQVKPEEISSSGQVEYPVLHIPFSLNLRPINDYNSKIGREFELLTVKATLRVTDKNFICSNTFAHLAYHITRECNYSFRLDFPIPHETLLHIEKWRKENLKFYIELQFQIAEYEKIRLGSATAQNKPIDINVVNSFSNVSTQFHFEIQQSFWIKNILPNLGYNKIRLIEIPITNEIIPKEYEKAVKELDAANDYFLKGDYDKTVAHCRAAVESVKKKLPTIKEALTSKSEYDWIKKVFESTDSWLDTMTNTTWQITSKTHHFPSLDHFSREQAEIIKLITVGIVAFAGRVEHK